MLECTKSIIEDEICYFIQLLIAPSQLFLGRTWPASGPVGIWPPSGNNEAPTGGNQHNPGHSSAPPACLRRVPGSLLRPMQQDHERPAARTCQVGAPKRTPYSFHPPPRFCSVPSPLKTLCALWRVPNLHENLSFSPCTCLILSCASHDPSHTHKCPLLPSIQLPSDGTSAARQQRGRRPYPGSSLPEFLAGGKRQRPADDNVASGGARRPTGGPQAQDAPGGVSRRGRGHRYRRAGGQQWPEWYFGALSAKWLIRNQNLLTSFPL